jgi:hypothetical protein
MALFPSRFGSLKLSESTARAGCGAAIHAGAWLAASWLIILVGGEAPTRYAYGMICGWWASLYLGYVCGVKIGAAAPGFAAYCLYGLIAWTFRWQWFYHDMPDRFDLSFVGVLVIRALGFTSPILLNALVSRARVRWPTVRG